MSFKISIEGTDDSFECGDGQNALAAMEKLGRKGIPVGCRGGGCGICRVQVVGQMASNKNYRTLKMSRAQVSEQDVAAGIALACKLIPQGDILLRPLGKLQKCLNPASRFLKESQQAG